MKVKTEIVLRVAITSVVFAVIFMAVILISTLIVQGEKHPDYWVTTPYDITTGAIVALLYFFSITVQIRRIMKKSSKRESAEAPVTK